MTEKRRLLAKISEIFGGNRRRKESGIPRRRSVRNLTVQRRSHKKQGAADDQDRKEPLTNHIQADIVHKIPDSGQSEIAGLSVDHHLLPIPHCHRLPNPLASVACNDVIG